MITQERLQAIREQFSGWEVEAVMLTNANNRRWLSNFTGSAGIVFITATEAYLATDFRYWEQAEKQSPDFRLVKLVKRQEDLAKLFTDLGIKKIGFEVEHVTVAAHDRLNEIEGITWVGLPAIVEPLRQIKREAEVDAIFAAAQIADIAMATFKHIARPGVSEKAAAWQLEKIMRETGADGLAFDIIVATGTNSALPHHRPSDREMAEGDVIVVDLGAQLNGYNSDITRTFHLGSEPDDKFWQIYNLVAEAHKQAIAGIRPGISGKDADALARNLIDDGGYKENFGHSLGHGVGLQVHEGPNLSFRNEDGLNAGNIVTVEPGIYLPEWGGVRIEDLVLVTENGVRTLSHCPKEPIISIE